jgi:hypothetical protein
MNDKLGVVCKETAFPANCLESLRKTRKSQDSRCFRQDTSYSHLLYAMFYSVWNKLNTVILSTICRLLLATVFGAEWTLLSWQCHLPFPVNYLVWNWLSCVNEHCTRWNLFIIKWKLYTVGGTGIMCSSCISINCHRELNWNLLTMESSPSWQTYVRKKIKERIEFQGNTNCNLKAQFGLTKMVTRNN